MKKRGKILLIPGGIIALFIVLLTLLLRGSISRAPCSRWQGLC